MDEKRQKLIIIEGLTGSGKSILAHFIARQASRQGLSVDWIHESEMCHPILIEYEGDIGSYMQRMQEQWGKLIHELDISNRILVIEACYFNNFIERLMVEDLREQEILDYLDNLQQIFSPLNPALIYLTQSDTRASLIENFANRGDSFRDFVIDLATGTAYARSKGLHGFEGMLRFWEAFVHLTDQVFERFPFPKIRLELIHGDWEHRNREALTFLGIPYTPEDMPSSADVALLVGTYLDENTNRIFEVSSQGSDLMINIFLKTNSRLIYQSAGRFLVEGWHFEIIFEEDDRGGMRALQIGGKDVDYLRLVGTTAHKQNQADENE